jgi:lysophospholipase L1-like esterase
MKSTLLLCGVLMLSSVICMAQAGVSADTAHRKLVYDTVHRYSKHFQERVQLFRTEPISKGHVIFFGNSITERGNWRALTGDSGAINRGISGDVTYGLLARLDDIIDRAPSRLYMMIGINDLARGFSVDTVCAHYEQILQRLRSAIPSTKVYIESVLPINDEVRKNKGMHPLRWKLNDSVLALNKRVRKIARAYHCTWVDTHDLFMDKEGNMISGYTDDGIHPNAAGYYYWIAYLRKKGFL